MRMNHDIIKEELDRIYEMHNRLTPQDVVADAERDTSPIHGCFEWDDEKAGHQYRLVQARTMIARVRVLTPKESAPEYVNVRVGDQQYYEKTTVAVRDPDLWGQIIGETQAMIERAQLRLRQLASVENDASRADFARSIERKLGKVSGFITRREEEQNHVREHQDHDRQSGRHPEHRAEG